MNKTAILLAVLLMTSTVAYSETGNELLAYCQGDMGGKDYCLGYVSGAMESYPIAAGVYNAPRLLCIPEGVTRGQTAKVVEHYLEAHPEDLHESARVLVYVAIRTTWPCK
jgi:hypothetical protein